MDIIALSSLNEGTPVSLIEAQACNNPVVSTNVGGIENIVVNGKTGLLSQINDIDGYAQNLLELMKMIQTPRNEAKRMNVKNSFSYRRLVKDIDSLYKKLLDK